MKQMLLFLAILSFSLSAQDEKKQAPVRAASQKEIDEAVHKGVEFLKAAPSPGAHSGIKNSDELILFTLLHAGVSEKNEVFQKYLKAVLDAPLEKTYKVALQAMALEELDRDECRLLGAARLRRGCLGWALQRLLSRRPATCGGSAGPSSRCTGCWPSRSSSCLRPA